MKEKDKQNITILVVDDYYKEASGIAACLKDENYNVLIAGSHEDFLKKYKRNNPDLVILDYLEDDIDGVKSVEEIKKNYPSGRILFLTESSVVADEVMKKGAYDIVNKLIRDLGTGLLDPVKSAIDNGQQGVNYQKIKKSLH